MTILCQEMIGVYEHYVMKRGYSPFPPLPIATVKNKKKRRVMPIPADAGPLLT